MNIGFSNHLGSDNMRGITHKISTIRTAGVGERRPGGRTTARVISPRQSGVVVSADIRRTNGKSMQS